MKHVLSRAVRSGRCYLHGWYIFFRALRMQRVKKHGGGRQDWRSAIFIARCARWIAAQQHKPHLNPFYGYGE